MDWITLQRSENRILPEKIPNTSPGFIGTMGNTLTSLEMPGWIDIKNDLFVPDSIYASSVSRFGVPSVDVAMQFLVSFQASSSL